MGRDSVALDPGGMQLDWITVVERCSCHALDAQSRWPHHPERAPVAGPSAVLEDLYPVQWTDGQAVVSLPEHIGASNDGQVRDALLSVINLGAATLIADMTATLSCDHAGADAVVRAWQRTISSGTELRLAVTAANVLRALGLRGLDRQVSVYSSLEAAVAARPGGGTHGTESAQGTLGISWQPGRIGEPRLASGEPSRARQATDPHEPDGGS